ncbi:helix-turn-helix domain-containing protein [Actinokineospora pegani]|uniref:helix-turn-helix domain-containing protein n=1 Tax=Actinokineospora pegani TaxID=2654637 RepID=UPI0018D35E2C|nr:helix-turn-helix transcriptional regulator [Actinokineospora pegani]
MLEGTTGSTVPRRQLGRYLRDLRNRARLTLKVAAVELEWSEAKMWRIETGQTSLRSLDVEAMCRLYDAPVDQTEMLKALAKETKAKGWWMADNDVLPEGFSIYLGLEEAAARVRSYESDLVPGLLQTERYARAIMGGGKRGAAPEEINRRVQIRMARKALYTRSTRPVDLQIVLSETILKRPIGGPEVMVEQLRELITVGSRANVTIRVVPFRAGLNLGVLSGSFVLLEFPTTSKGQPSEPTTVYADGYTGSLFLDKPAEVERHELAFADLWEHCLSQTDSLTYIEAAAREMDR